MKKIYKLSDPNCPWCSQTDSWDATILKEMGFQVVKLFTEDIHRVEGLKSFLQETVVGEMVLPTYVNLGDKKIIEGGCQKDLFPLFCATELIEPIYIEEQECLGDIKSLCSFVSQTYFGGEPVEYDPTFHLDPDRDPVKPFTLRSESKEKTAYSLYDFFYFLESEFSLP